jgi:elongation factor P
VETGATVMVPLFVEEGELIRVNAKTGEYIERVKA